MRTHPIPLLLLLLATLLLPACATREEALTSRADAVLARDHLAAAVTTLERQLATLPADHPARPDLESRLARSRTGLDALGTGIAQIDAALSQPPPDPATNPFLDSLLRTIPIPWQAPILLGGAGLALFLRSRQLRQGITSIAQGIEIAKRDDPVFRESFERHANTFRSIQSPTARKLVDTVTGTPRAGASRPAIQSPSSPPTMKPAIASSQE